MNIEKAFNTTGLLLGGAFCIVESLKEGLTNSPLSILKTGSILFPLSVLIGITTKKIFTNMGWQSSENRNLTICMLTSVSSVFLTSAAAIKFGFADSLETALKMNMIIVQPLLGIGLLRLGMQNIYSGKNHRYIDYYMNIPRLR
jgi:hypothetical protein